jgi:hypothetical protein
MLGAVEALSHLPHLKSKVQSRDSDSVSDEEDQENTQTHQVWDPCMQGHPHRSRDFSCEVSPTSCLQAASSQKFYIVPERLDPNSPGIQQAKNNPFKLENRFHWEHLKK